jgi:hypothetical protein
VGDYEQNAAAEEEHREHPLVVEFAGVSSATSI